jgi:hypothetical protein
VDTLLEEYFTRFYGPAAEPMRRYWMRWEEAMVATGATAHGGYEWLRMFTPELLGECARLLDEAERQAAGGSDKVQKRVALARAGFRFTEAGAGLRDHASRGDLPRAVQAGEEALTRIRETEGSSPQAFRVDLAVGQMEALLLPYREALAGGPGTSPP